MIARSTTTPVRLSPDIVEPGGEALMKRAISLSFEFSRAIVDDPALLDDIPDGVTLVLIPDDDPELAASEIDTGIMALRRGSDVYFRHVRRGPTGELIVTAPPSGRATSEAPR